MKKDQLTQEEALDLDEIMRLIDMPVSDASPEPALEYKEPDPQPANESQLPDPKDDKKNKKTNPHQSVVLYLHDLAYLMAVIVLVFLLCLRIVVVSGDSMYDTLIDGDYLLLVTNVFYQEPQAGDIIVVSKADYDNGMPIVKRIIATEGQTVDIDFITGTVYVDGNILEEDYIYTKTTLDEGVAFPLTVEEGCVFVLGDNRSRSKDSRNPEIGLIDHRQIVGKAIMLVFPGTDEGEQEREYDRIGVIG